MTLTLHERVEDDILDRIQTGDWQVGDRLPIPRLNAIEDIV